jgi:hypothetical protein
MGNGGAPGTGGTASVGGSGGSSSGAGGFATRDAGIDTSDAAGSTSDGDGGMLSPLYVSALSGDDSNSGDESHPLKTLKKAWLVARSGQTVRLFAGTYDAHNGEDYAGAVPDGVTVEAVSSGDAVLDGQGLDRAKLSLAGSATIRNLKLKNFWSALFIQSGDVDVSGLELTANYHGLEIGENAAVTASSIRIHDGVMGAAVYGSATLTVNDSTVTDMTDTECGSGTGFYADYSATLRLNGVTATGINGEVVELRRTSSAFLDRCLLTKNGAVGCGNMDSIMVGDSSSLTMSDTDIRAPNDPQATIVWLTTYGDVEITNGTISGAVQGEGVSGSASWLTLVGATISDNDTGVRSTGSLHVIEGHFSDNSRYHIDSVARGAIIRHTEFLPGVVGNDIAVHASDSSRIDLGTADDPGGNNIQGSLSYGLSAEGAFPQIDAAGNSWRPATQGSDGIGTYASGTVVTGPDCPAAKGKSNYCISTGSSIQF